MEDLLKYGIELAAAAVAAVVAIKVAVARMDERLTTLRIQIDKLERKHTKLENKMEEQTEAIHSLELQVTRLATIIEKKLNA